MSSTFSEDIALLSAFATFSRVCLRGGGGSCLDYDGIVGLPICQTLLLSFLNYGEILLPLWRPTNGSVIVVN